MSDVLKMKRRQFLLGSGGFVVAIPTLSSLFAREARAQLMMPQKRFVGMLTDHGGVFPRHMYPDDPANMTTNQLYGPTSAIPAHITRWGALSARRENGQAIISECLTAPSDALPDSLLAKINVVAGLDITTYIGHNRASILGNYGANDQGESLHGMQMMTIDQVIANQDGFNLAPVKEQSLHFAQSYGDGSNVRFSASAQLDDAGTPVPVQADNDPRVLWQRLFADQMPPGPQRPLVVDRVYEHYRRVTTGAFGDAARLSTADRQRLENHMTRLLELERKLAVRVDCDLVTEPPYLDDAVERLRVANDLIAAALICGASNIAVISAAGSRLSVDQGWNNWHEQIAHNGGGSFDQHDPNFQRINYRAQGRFFSEVFLDLARKLDVEESDGTTVLDNSFLMWGQESGDVTHDNISIPVVTAGSAAGFFHTGRFIDFRNRDQQIWVSPQKPDRRPGILYNQWLGNVLQSMGVAPATYHSELQRVQPDEFANGTRGFGVAQYHPSNFWDRIDLRTDIWPERYYRDADQLLWGLVA